jgi:hypothetical protein
VRVVPWSGFRQQTERAWFRVTVEFMFAIRRAVRGSAPGGVERTDCVRRLHD